MGVLTGRREEGYQEEKGGVAAVMSRGEEPRKKKIIQVELQG